MDWVIVNKNTQENQKYTFVNRNAKNDLMGSTSRLRVYNTKHRKSPITPGFAPPIAR